MTTVALWQAVTDAAWTFMEDLGYRPDRCVLQTRLLAEVARRRPELGRARALNTSVLAGNAAWREAVLTGRVRASDPVSSWPPEVWTVGVDPALPPAGPSRFPGHLCLLVEGEVLVDGTAPQLARPDRGIHVTRPVAARVPPHFLGGDDPLVLIDDDGTSLIYRDATGTGMGWQHAPDWRPPPPVVLRPLLDRVDRLNLPSLA